MHEPHFLEDNFALLPEDIIDARDIYEDEKPQDATRKALEAAKRAIQQLTPKHCPVCGDPVKDAKQIERIIYVTPCGHHYPIS